MRREKKEQLRKEREAEAARVRGEWAAISDFIRREPVKAQIIMDDLNRAIARTFFTGSPA